MLSPQTLSCDRRNHFDCLHTYARAQGEASYFSLLDHPEDLDWRLLMLSPQTLSCDRRKALSDEQDYLVGWTVVAQAVREQVDLSDSIVYLEQNGCRDACDLGMRDAILAAYGDCRPIRHPPTIRK